MSRQSNSPIAPKMSSLPAGRQVDRPVLSTRQKFFWARPSQQVVDIFREPIANFERLSKAAKTRNRQTQTTLADPAFRVLRQDENWSLVQLADGTFGWLANSSLRKVKSLNYWEKIKPALQEKLVEIKAPSEQKVRKILTELEGIPYLWGGTTKNGMDCSAFTQKFCWQIGGILLPRNSREQKKRGRAVQSTKLRSLDLLFFVHSTTGRHHVGVYWNEKIWHFCLDKKGLTYETIESIKKRYNHLATRRIFKLKNARSN